MKSRSVPTLLLPLICVLLLTATAAAEHASAFAVDSSSSRNASANATAPTITVSFCELCRDEGKCDQAYHGSAGIFCGGKRSRDSGRLACCCPADGVCLRDPSSYNCACGSRASRTTTRDASVKDEQDKLSGGGGGHKIIWTVTAALFMGILVAMYLYSTRGDRSYHYRAPQRTERARAAQPATPPATTSTKSESSVPPV
jgi:hypothetical protein